MKTLVVPIFALALLAGCGSPAPVDTSAQDVEGDKPVVKKEEPPVSATTNEAGVQMATVSVDGKFSPAEVHVKKGQPVELVFDTKNRSCAETVVFKVIDQTVHLKDGEKTTVKFTPKDAGTIDYACSMDMIKGKIVVE
ncbi:MAG: cupredoxin domain-containing protein [Fimbriimonadaceae bacterium]|nr:cupredoxin domain-containing protein [Fimbriimonadaceae bacterium]